MLKYDIDLYPFYRLPRRLRTGTTPPSPLRSPPERTPIPLTYPSAYSPQKYPDVPQFNVRRVHSPYELPREELGFGVSPSVLYPIPYYGHSTPKARIPRYTSPDRWTPGTAKRKLNWERRERAISKMPERAQLSLNRSPISVRQDADSFFEEGLVPFSPEIQEGLVLSPPETLPRSPKYERAPTPARSPALELMVEEMKKDDEREKYTIWYRNHIFEAAMRHVVMEGICDILKERFPDVDYEKMNVHDIIALLSEYLRNITDKLLTQNLELPPLATNNPALSIVEQKKISIRRIIREYKEQYEAVNSRLGLVKHMIEFRDLPRLRKFYDEYREQHRKELEELDVEKRMERIVARSSLCFPWCPHQKTKNHYERDNKPLEKELDELRLKIVELDAECMEAMADMTQFVDVVSPNFLKNLAGLIRTMYPGRHMYTIPPEAYEEAAKDVSKHLRRIFKQKRQEWVEVNREVNNLYPVIKDKREEIDNIETALETCQKENLKLRAEFQKYKTHSLNMEWMVSDARKMLRNYEHAYAGTYQDLNREKKKTAELEAKLGMSPRGPPELSAERESPRTSSPIITHPRSPTSVDSPPGEVIGSPVHASSPAFASSPPRQDTSHSLGGEQPPSEMLDISDLSRSGGSVAPERTLRAPLESDNLDDQLPPSAMRDFSGLQGGASFLDSPERSASSIKKTVSIPSPSKNEQLQIDIEIIPQDIRRSPSGQRVVCDVAVELQEAAVKPPRRIERRYHVVRGTPPISETVGRRVDRRHGMFTPRSVIRRRHVGVRRPLFEGDFESPESPWGTGRRTHPELMNLPRRPPSPRPPPLNTTIEWEDPNMNRRFRE